MTQPQPGLLDANPTALYIVNEYLAGMLLDPTLRGQARQQLLTELQGQFPDSQEYSLVYKDFREREKAKEAAVFASLPQDPLEHPLIAKLIRQAEANPIFWKDLPDYLHVLYRFDEKRARAWTKYHREDLKQKATAAAGQNQGSGRDQGHFALKVMILVSMMTLMISTPFLALYYNRNEDTKLSKNLPIASFQDNLLHGFILAVLFSLGAMFLVWLIMTFRKK